VLTEELTSVLSEHPTQPRVLLDCPQRLDELGLILVVQAGTAAQHLPL